MQPLLFADEKTEEIEANNGTVAEQSHLLTPGALSLPCCSCCPFPLSSHPEALNT